MQGEWTKLAAGILIGMIVGSLGVYLLFNDGDASRIEELEAELERTRDELESRTLAYEARVEEYEQNISSLTELVQSKGEIIEEYEEDTGPSDDVIDILEEEPLDHSENGEDVVADLFGAWWSEYSKPLHVDYSSYPGFWRGAYACRLDEMRSYLVNAEVLRQSGFDTILMGADLVIDPETGTPYTPAIDVFAFYVQAFKRAGFRVILVPNPMHPNLDMGEGFAWEPGTAGRYQPSPDLIAEFDSAVVTLARLAEEYGAYGFLPCIEPYKLSRDLNATSDWLQGVQHQIRVFYGGLVGATDIMWDIGEGYSWPFPYDYTGFDFIVGGPPAGREDASSWEAMIDVYIGKGVEYTEAYDASGFGLYEWGGYTGGVWYEPISQLLDDGQALSIAEAGIRQGEGRMKSCFPRISLGWMGLDTPSYDALSEWYLSMGDPVSPVVEESWSGEELTDLEESLAGSEEELRKLFTIEGPYQWPH
jgi:hypothetical protein